MKKPVNDMMMIRSVYLPPELDHKIAALAFTDSVSKSDMMTEMVRRGIEHFEKTTLSGKRSDKD